MVNNSDSPDCPDLPGSTPSSVNESLNCTNNNNNTSTNNNNNNNNHLCNQSSEGESISPGGSVSVATISTPSTGNGPPGLGGPSFLPVGIPFLPGLGPDPSSPFYSAHHPGVGFDLKENMEAWKSIPAYASMYGGYDRTILAGYPAMLRNSYGMDLNGSRRKNATRETTSTLKAWLNDHRKNPYPTKAEKIMLAIITQMSLTQVSTWFANARRRLKKENKMTWSPRNRCDDDNDEECSLNQHRSVSNSNNDQDQIDPIGDIYDDSSSDNFIVHKRFKSSSSASGVSAITTSTTPTLSEHHNHHPFHHLHRMDVLPVPLSQQQQQPPYSSLSPLNNPLDHHHRPVSPVKSKIWSIVDLATSNNTK